MLAETECANVNLMMVRISHHNVHFRSMNCLLFTFIPVMHYLLRYIVFVVSLSIVNIIMDAIKHKA